MAPNYHIPMALRCRLPCAPRTPHEAIATNTLHPWSTEGYQRSVYTVINDMMTCAPNVACFARSMPQSQSARHSGAVFLSTAYHARSFVVQHGS